MKLLYLAIKRVKSMNGDMKTGGWFLDADLSWVKVTFLRMAATQTGLMTRVDSWIVRRSRLALGGTSLL